MFSTILSKDRMFLRIHAVIIIKVYWIIMQYDEEPDRDDWEQRRLNLELDPTKIHL